MMMGRTRSWSRLYNQNSEMVLNRISRLACPSAVLHETVIGSRAGIRCGFQVSGLAKQINSSSPKILRLLKGRLRVSIYVGFGSVQSTEIG